MLTSKNLERPQCGAVSTGRCKYANVWFREAFNKRSFLEEANKLTAEIEGKKPRLSA